MSSESDILLYSPFIHTRETVSSSRYFWDGMERGNHSIVIIQRTISGKGMFTFEGRTHPVPGDHAFITVVPEPAVYYYPRDAEEPWDFSWLNFYGPLAARLCSDFRKAYGPVLPLPENSKAGLLFLRLSSGKVKPADPYENSALCYEFMMEWAREVALPRQQAQSPVEVAMNVCAARFREPLGVKELAEATGLSREHFTRIFTAQTGKSPARHLRDLRVKAAHDLLEGGHLPAKEVALRCGFPSVRALRSALQESSG